ncbi:MAG: TonB-dependent receptor [Ignavibacteria bacterium]|jgi:outer membrane receptor for Fe3+-dicitrate
MKHPLLKFLLIVNIVLAQSIDIQKFTNYLLFNFRLSCLIKPYKDVDLQVFLRVNNVFDKLYYTQWSLPEPGRQFRVGSFVEF